MDIGPWPTDEKERCNNRISLMSIKRSHGSVGFYDIKNLFNFKFYRCSESLKVLKDYKSLNGYIFTER